jgi:hypothetical protein
LKRKYALTRQLDASIAGSMATVTGVFFLLALLFAPERGLVARWPRLRWQRVVGHVLRQRLAERVNGNRRLALTEKGARQRRR